MFCVYLINNVLDNLVRLIQSQEHPSKRWSMKLEEHYCCAPYDFYCLTDVDRLKLSNRKLKMGVNLYSTNSHRKSCKQIHSLTQLTYRVFKVSDCLISSYVVARVGSKSDWNSLAACLLWHRQQQKMNLFELRLKRYCMRKGKNDGLTETHSSW